MSFKEILSTDEMRMVQIEDDLLYRTFVLPSNCNPILEQAFLKKKRGRPPMIAIRFHKGGEAAKILGVIERHELLSLIPEVPDGKRQLHRL